MQLGLVIEESQGLQTHLNVVYDVLWGMVLPLTEDPRLYLSMSFHCLGHFLAEERGFCFMCKSTHSSGAM